MDKQLRYWFLLLCLLLQSCDNTQLTYLREDAIILAFGDSLTYGVGAKPEQSYPKQLEKHLNRSVINAGISGEVSANGLKRLPKLLDLHKPHLVILCHGANDILRKLDLNQTKSNIQKMIMLIQKSGAEVVLLAVPTFSLFLAPAPFYKELADSNDIVFLEDTLSGILTNNALKSDYVHPNADGYRLMTEKIEVLLLKKGALRQSSN